MIKEFLKANSNDKSFNDKLTKLMDIMIEHYSRLPDGQFDEKQLFTEVITRVKVKRECEEIKKLIGYYQKPQEREKVNNKTYK